MIFLRKRIISFREQLRKSDKEKAGLYQRRYGSVLVLFAGWPSGGGSIKSTDFGELTGSEYVRKSY